MVEEPAEDIDTTSRSACCLVSTTPGTSGCVASQAPAVSGLPKKFITAQHRSAAGTVHVWASPPTNTTAVRGLQVAGPPGRTVTVMPSPEMGSVEVMTVSVEHVGHAEGVDRAHRPDCRAAVDGHPVGGRYRGERVRRPDPPLVIEPDHVLVVQLGQQATEIATGGHGIGEGDWIRGIAGAGEPAQDRPVHRTRGGCDVRDAAARHADGQRRRISPDSRYVIAVMVSATGSPDAALQCATPAVHLARTHEDLSATALLERLIIEGVDQLDYPGIVFRGPAHDRRAALAAGPDVWEIISRLQELDGSEESRIATLSAESDLHPRLIRIALDYAADHPHEVRARIDRNRAMVVRSREATAQRGALLA